MNFLNRIAALLAFVITTGTISTTFAGWIDVEARYIGDSSYDITVIKNNGLLKIVKTPELIEEKFDLQRPPAETFSTVSFERSNQLAWGLGVKGKRFELWLNSVRKGIEVFERVNQSRTGDFNEACFISVKPEEILLDKTLGKLTVLLTDDGFIFNFEPA